MKSKNLVIELTRALTDFSEKATVSDHQKTWSYRELLQYAYGVGHYLKTTVKKSKPIVGIVDERSIECIGLMLGTVLYGGCFVFFNPNSSQSRLSQTVSISEIDLLFSSSELNLTESLACVSPYCIKANNQPVTASDIHCDDLCYMMFTSGTTGVPKAVMVSYDNLASLLFTEGHHLIDRQGQQLAVLANLFFDMSIFMIFMGVLTASHIYLTSYREKAVGDLLVDCLIDRHIVYFDVTPNYLRLIEETCRTRQKHLSEVARIFSIGDELATSLVKSMFNYLSPDAEIFNTYGPAECTIFVTYQAINSQAIANGQQVTIGYPTSNATVKCYRDGHFADEGEIVISGQCVGLGYRGDTALQAPFEKIVGYYFTGDYGIVDHNNQFHFVGRIDRQRKLNGYRIELNAIEHLANQLEGVIQSRAVIQNIADNWQALVLYYTGESEAKAAIKDHLSDQLPKYSQPQDIRWLAEFQTNANGKIDDKQLITQYNNESVCTMTTFSEVVSYVLQKNDIDCEKSLIENSASSLDIFSIQAHCQVLLNLKIPLPLLMSEQSIVAITSSLNRYNINSESVSYSAKNHYVTNSALKIIKAEQQLDCARSTAIIVRYKQVSDAERHRFLRAVEQVFQQHEICQFSIVKKGRKYLYEKQSRASIKVNHRVASQRELLRWRDGVNLVVDNFQSDITLYFKHSLFDYLSVRYFMEEVAHCYRHGRPINIYKKEYMKASAHSRADELFWKSQLANLPEVIPSDVKGLDTYQTRVINFKWCSQTAQNQHIAHTKFFSMLSTFIRAYFNAYPVKGLIVGLYVPGRQSANDYTLIAMMTKILPLIVWRDEIDNEFETRLDTKVQQLLNHQAIDINTLYQMIPLEYLKSGDFIAIAFNYENQLPPFPFRDKQVPAEILQDIVDVTNRKLFVNIIEDSEDIKLIVRHDSECFSSNGIDALTNHWLDMIGVLHENNLSDDSSSLSIFNDRSRVVNYTR